MADFLVRRDDLAECRVAEAEPPTPRDGEAVLRVSSFGLTANNVTYGLFGEAMRYWDFFPAADGWGRIPVWGFAEVESSRADGVRQGTRVYGFLPPSSRLRVVPVAVDPAGFVDGAAHREPLPSAYHRYLATGPDPFHRPDSEDLQMLLRPIFFTAFLVDDQLADEGLLDRGPILISSASSKTALALAHLLARRGGRELVALTSARNLDFVRGLGLYSEAVPYEEIGSLPARAGAFVDVAGNASVREAVHSRLGDGVARSVLVGATHWDRAGAETADLAGPAPVFFFAPDRVKKRSSDWGRAALAGRVAEAWHPFCEWAGSWLAVDRVSGLEGVPDAYGELLAGRVPPERAHVVELAGEGPVGRPGRPPLPRPAAG